MRNRLRLIALAVLAASVVIVIVFLIARGDVAVLNPAGVIGRQQRNLLVVVTLLMLIVVIPVFILTFAIAWKYRAGNHKAHYRPEWDHNAKLEALWWAIPCAIIFVLAIVAWNSSHTLDPFRAIRADKPPVTIQVVALQWKWLFLYPEQHIASVNYVQFPAGTPVNFEITSDAPMNSFWIPKLGGQVYAMSGMTTKLHLEADKPGTFRGSSANISGEGFAGMHFTARATTDKDFADWVKQARSGSDSLTAAAYTKLALPAEAKSNTVYATYEHNLYDTVVNKYLAPQPNEQAARGANKE